ncbi:PAS domain S-box protein [Rubrivirga marina]|uniref:histidine kinase n=1 Tax=Rubrivirga marina TaxID=1196024 RepID=A0A271J0Y8_9BACT|nr:PAS domain S-box protein [Rubrivirga marina]PAP77123.1 hypothetical protein BSZ37_12145 [Rubrivirga marina]
MAEYDPARGLGREGPPSDTDDLGSSWGTLGDVPDGWAFAEMVVDTVREGLLVLGRDLRVVAANESFYRTFGGAAEETVGRPVYDLGDGPWDTPEFRGLLEDVLPRDGKFDGYEVDHEFERFGRRVVVLNGRRLRDPELVLLAIEDATELRTAERALSASEERFELFAENAREYAVIGMDAEGRITTWSPSAERILGWTRAEAVGRSGAIFFTEADREAGAVERERDQARRDGSALDERWHVRKDGSRFWGTGVMIALQDGDLRGYAKVLRDNTQRRAAEDALRASERTAQARLDELEAVYATAPVGLCVLDRDFRYVRINQHLAEINGLPVEAHLGRTIFEVVPDLADEAAGVLRQIFETGDPVLGIEITGETAAAPGVERTWVENWLPLRDRDGHVVGVNVVAEDVTERRRAEQELREAEGRFRAYADAAPAILWVTDPDGRATFLSRDWYDYTGQAEGEALGYGWLDAVHPDDRGPARAAFLDANERQVPFRLDYRLRRHDGVYRWALDAGRPLDEDGFGGFVGSVIDIDDRRRAEDDVRELNRTLEERVEDRTAQVRSLSRALTLAEHEERRRLAQVLHDDLQQVLHGAQIQAAVGNVERVETLLGEAIQTARSLSHELAPPILRGRRLDELLAWVAERERALYGLEVEHDGGTVEVPEEEVRILLYQLLRELLLNVAKHAGVPAARVTAEQVDSGVRVVIEDEGAGFDVAVTPGGLGLASVRERLEAVGGRLTVESAPGEGTRVSLDVPVDE